MIQPGHDQLHRSEYRLPPAQQPGILSQSDYERFRAFALEKIGLDYPEEKRSMLSRGVMDVMDTSGCTDLDQLYQQLSTSSPTSLLWDRLISALTIGETYFFRNASQFDVLAKRLLPDILAQRERSNRHLRIWSAGCATGEEPYSIAILLRELVPNLASWNITILATDINRDALRKAQEGVYSPWSFRGVEKRIQETYFRPNGDKQFCLSDDIKRMVHFDYLNLAGDPYPSLMNNTNAMDVIFCRNVTIYFTAAVTQKVVNALKSCLVEGGWLIPGSSEPNLVFFNDLEAKNFPGTVIYQKPTAQPIPVAPAVTFSRSSVRIDSLPTAPVDSFVPSAPPPERTATAKTSNAADVFQIALELLRNGQPDQALVKLYENLDHDPNFVPTYYTLGKIFANLGDLTKAQHWCEQAIAKDKLHPEPYYILSMIYQQQGLLGLALDALKKTVYLDRNFVLAHYNLAQIYRELGETAAAKKSLQNVQQLLTGQAANGLIPEGDGLVVGRLMEIVENQLAQNAVTLKLG